LAFEDLGERELKNIARPCASYRLRTPTESKALPSRVRPAAAGQALHRRPSVYQYERRPRAAVLRRRDRRGHPHRPRAPSLVVRDRPQLELHLQGRHVDVRQVGRELGVRYVLEGSVRKGGNRIRITGQLIEAETGAHLWAERYDRALDDVFAIQDEITDSVIGCIQPQVYAAEHERLRRKPPQRLDAWESIVRGMFLYSQHSDASTKEALTMLDRAVVLDPGYAQAHGLRAVCLAWRAFQGWENRDTAFTRAAEGADRAVACDPGEPWAHLARGFIGIANRHDSAAVGAFSRAIDASPNFAYAHGLLGAAHALGGRPDQAIECIDRGVRLSPRDIFGEEYQLYYAFAHFQVGRYAEAASAAQLAIQQRPEHPVLYIMAAASYGPAGEIDKATRAIAQLTDLVPGYRLSTSRRTSSIADKKIGAGWPGVYGWRASELNARDGHRGMGHRESR
jgi:Flp pilus assembly protein TadD